MRRSGVDIIYQSANITKDVERDKLEFTYTDNATGRADDVSLTIKDDAGKWISSWAPKAGDTIRPILWTKDWNREGDSARLDCGIFMVDEVQYAGPPRTVIIKATSTPANTDFMHTPRSDVWDGASVKEIAQTIAGNAGLRLVFDSKADPIHDFLEQSEESDASFLYSVCQRNGLAMKLYNKRIVIFDEVIYESRKPVLTLEEKDMLKWSCGSSLTDSGYDGCRTVYVDMATGGLIEYLYRIPGRRGNKIYHVNDECLTIAEAERLAKASVREKNKSEFTFSCSVPGNLSLVSSQTVNIRGFGKFDGKYYIDRVSRKLGSGLVTSLDMHRTLGGY